MPVQTARNGTMYLNIPSQGKFTATAKALRLAADTPKADKVERMLDTYTEVWSFLTINDIRDLLMAYPEQVLDFMYADMFLAEVKGG